MAAAKAEGRQKALQEELRELVDVVGPARVGYIELVEAVPV